MLQSFCWDLCIRCGHAVSASHDDHECVRQPAATVVARSRLGRWSAPSPCAWMVKLATCWPQPSRQLKDSVASHCPRTVPGTPPCCRALSGMACRSKRSPPLKTECPAARTSCSSWTCRERPPGCRSPFSCSSSSSSESAAPSWDRSSGDRPATAARHRTAPPGSGAAVAGPPVRSRCRRHYHRRRHCCRGSRRASRSSPSPTAAAQRGGCHRRHTVTSVALAVSHIRASAFMTDRQQFQLSHDSRADEPRAS